MSKAMKLIVKWQRKGIRTINNSIINPAKRPPDPMESVYGNHPDLRPWTLPEFVSVNVKDLFPTMPKSIYDGDEACDISAIDAETRKALEKVDMSSIRPDDIININCCEHGFLMFGGVPYVRMLKTLKKVVEERTGNYNIRLRCVMYRTPREGYEVIEHYRLNEEFDSIKTVAAYDKAVPIQTRIGTMYGLEACYDADKFIFAYYDDPREVWCSNYYRKSFKAFVMDMARFETRSMFHYAFGTPAGHGPVANIIPTAIYDSDFVQSKYAFTCMMRTTPAGITGFDADRDLYALDDRAIVDNVKYYPYMHQLLLSVSNYNVIIDQSRWPCYPHGAGLISGINWINYQDHYDLLAGKTGLDYSHMCADGLQTVIYNQAWTGLNVYTVPMVKPTIIVGDELYNMLKDDPTNKPYAYLPGVIKVDTLREAMDKAREISGSDNFVLYDGTFGFLNCTRGVAEELIANAVGIKEMIDEKYPMYMEQRGLKIPD